MRQAGGSAAFPAGPGRQLTDALSCPGTGRWDGFHLQERQDESRGVMSTLRSSSPRIARDRPTVDRLRLGVPRRLAVALLALGCVVSLLAPNQSWASSHAARHDTHAGSPQSHQARYVQVSPDTAMASPSRPDVRSTADGASFLLVLVLALNSAVMFIRVVTSPPSWMKD